MPFLDVRNINKAFRTRIALRDLSFSLDVGEALAFYGANGSGKSTILNLLAGVLRPDHGTISINGLSMKELRYNSAATCRFLDLVSSKSLMYGHLSVRENLNYFSRLIGLDNCEIVVRESMCACGVDLYADVKISECSQGIIKRAAIARAILGSPKLLLLDEPFVNIDSAGINALVSLLLKEKGKGTTIVFASHNIDAIRSLADKVLVLDNGRLQGSFDVSNFISTHQSDTRVNE